MSSRPPDRFRNETDPLDFAIRGDPSEVAEKSFAVRVKDQDTETPRCLRGLKSVRVCEDRNEHHVPSLCVQL
jgi:hypothetical protein